MKLSLFEEFFFVKWKKIIKDKDHLKSAATCTEDAVYYYDCAEAGCNTSGSTTWVDTDSKLGHDMGEWSNVGLDGNKTQECERDGYFPWKTGTAA